MKTAKTKLITTACTALLLTMMIVISLAACGRRNESSETDAYTHEGAGPRPGAGIAVDTTAGDSHEHDTTQTPDVQLIDRSQFYGETLTIYVLSRYHNNIGAITDEYMRQNSGVTIEVISFGGNLTRAIQETNIAIGEVARPSGAPPPIPPVLIESTLVNLHATHRFVNWAPFIYSTSDFNDYNFFMNVIEAMMVEDYLNEFPVAFSFSMVAANHSIPGLAEALEMYDGITMYRLLGLMRNFNITGYHPYPGVSHQRMYLWHNFDVGYGFEYLQDIFDSEDGTAEFNNQRFIDFLNHAYEVTYPDKVFGEDYAPPLHILRSPDWALVNWRYFFLKINTSDSHNIMPFFGDNPRNFVYAFSHLMFSGLTPIVSDYGDLIITNTSSYVLYTGATPIQQALAWDFMQFMASEEGARAASRRISSAAQGSAMARERLPMMNINRDAAHFSVRANWPAPDNFCNFAFVLTGTTYSEEAIPILDDWINDIGDMPMILAQTWPDAARLILQDFHNGAITAADAALIIQSLIEFEIAGTN